jgi:hypothetical protein
LSLLAERLQDMGTEHGLQQQQSVDHEAMQRQVADMVRLQHQQQARMKEEEAAQLRLIQQTEARRRMREEDAEELRLIQQAEARKRAREEKEQKVESLQLGLGPRQISPNDRAIVRYGEAKQYVLQRSDLQLKVQLLKMEVQSLRGHFIPTEEDDAIVQQATERAHIRFAKHGASKAVRDQRKIVLQTLTNRLMVEERAFEALRNKLKMLRLQKQLQQQRVEEDAYVAAQEEQDQEEATRLMKRENQLKMEKKLAAIENQKRILAMTFGESTAPSRPAAVAAAAVGTSPATAAARVRKRIVEDDGFEDDVYDPDEEARHAREDAEEAAAAAADKETEEDLEFIAPEDDE